MKGDYMKKINIIRIILGIVLLVLNFLIKFKLIGYVCYILLAWDIILNTFKNLKKGEIFDENFLMLVATFGALLIGDINEAIIVVLLYQIGESLSDRAVDKSKDKIIELMDLRSEKIRLKNGKLIQSEEIKIDDVITVNPGEKIPVDGIVIKGSGELDTKSLTGESMPITVGVDSKVLSGSINMNTTLDIKVTTSYFESTSSKIIDLIENANEKKSKTEKFITRFFRF